MGLKEKIVDEIIKDISDRKGIGDEWDYIDEDIQDEIKEEWQQIVNKELEKESDLKQEMLDILEELIELNYVDSEPTQNEIKAIIQKAKES